MPRFRKKPIVIQAVHYISGNEDEVRDFLDGCEGWHMGEGGIIIPTLEGNHLAEPGDWIIKGVIGEFYPCKSDVFEATYEKVEE